VAWPVNAKSKGLYIMGTPAAGKTALAAGLIQKLLKEGLRVAYFKPVAQFAHGREEDDDVALMRSLLGAEGDGGNGTEWSAVRMAGPSYLSLGAQRDDDARRHVRRIFEDKAASADAVVVGGSAYPYAYAGCGLDDLSLAGELGANALFVFTADNDFRLDQALFFARSARQAGIPLLGAVLNNVPRPLLAKTEGIYRPVLEREGCPVLGVIPRRREIASPTVEEYVETLGGELLAGENALDRLVGEVVIGAMTADSALTYFRRSADKAVFLGGDRAEVALAALETSTSVLVLTGGLYPDVRVIARAREKNVPVLLVHDDTFTAVEKVGHLTRRLKPGNAAALSVTLENVETYFRWSAVVEALR